MGVYGVVWTQLGHWYRDRGTAVLFRYLTVLFQYLMVLFHYDNCFQREDYELFLWHTNVSLLCLNVIQILFASGAFKFPFTQIFGARIYT